MLKKQIPRGLKTLALCWVYRKRAFSVSGQFRKALTDLITDLHNSNKKLLQVTLLEASEGREVLFAGFCQCRSVEIREKLLVCSVNFKTNRLRKQKLF